MIKTTSVGAQLASQTQSVQTQVNAIDSQEISLREFKQGYLNISVPAKGLKGEDLFIYIRDPEHLNKKIELGFQIERIGFSFEKIMDSVKPKYDATKKAYIDVKSYSITNLGLEVHDSSGNKMQRVKPTLIQTSKYVESMLIIGKEPTKLK